ncbi:MAG: TIGR03862 family flavoprotein [Rubripirellula sp.]
MNDTPNSPLAVDAVVIGAGPAGLMAAEMIADAGHRVWVVDAKATAGRKFLMAGKSGLNITKDEQADAFLANYESDANWIGPYVTDFGSEAVKQWANNLGQEVFTGSSNRVFPSTMKASPLLRAWLSRLATKNVQLKTQWRWQGWDQDALIFDSLEGRQTARPRVTVLALGGASWSRLGSDGQWSEILSGVGVPLEPFQAANMGFVIDWSPYMAPHFGAAIKPLRLTAGNTSVLGEMVLSSKGIEGGGVYAVSRAMREGAPLVLDLAPDVAVETLNARLVKLTRKASRSSMLRKAFGFDAAKSALMNEFARGVPTDALASVAKSLAITHRGPRPMDEAISTAGGVRKDGVDEKLMLRAKPGVFCAGEMLDWEAPTGGYLITACLATGRTAGKGAVDFLATLPPTDG